MLKGLEYSNLESIERCTILSSLIDQAQKAATTEAIVLSEVLTDVVDESLARGWIYSASLQDLISAMDSRLDKFSMSQLTQIFDFEEIHVWTNATKSIPSIANRAVAMRDAAFLLCQLKAMGFRVDDAVISSRLRPLLAKKRFLVGREFYVFWQEELEAKREAFVLYCAPLSPKSTFKTATLPLGNEMRIAQEGNLTIGVEITHQLLSTDNAS